MMTPNEIIQELYEEKFIERHISKLSKSRINAYDAQDLAQYLYLYMLEHPEKLTEVHSKGNLRYYTLMMIKRQVNSKNSWFARQIRTKDEKQTQIDETHTPG